MLHGPFIILTSFAYPGLLFAIGVAVTIHPIVIGVVLAFAGQAILVRRNTGRAEAVNAAAPSP